jgi:hypothetical protein
MNDVAWIFPAATSLSFVFTLKLRNTSSNTYFVVSGVVGHRNGLWIF